MSIRKCGLCREPITGPCYSCRGMIRTGRQTHAEEVSMSQTHRPTQGGTVRPVQRPSGSK